jgi:chemotaxis protein histidine kinase CheA
MWEKDMQFPDLSALPQWAQVIVYATFGISLAFIIGAARFGVMLGKKGSSQSATTTTRATVAAVIVDATELQKIVAVAASLDATLGSMNKTGQSLARATAAEARESREFAETLKELAQAIDRLRDELMRASAK